VVHSHAFALQQGADPTVAETTALARDLTHRCADIFMVRRAFAPDRLLIDTDKPAGSTLRDIVIPHRPACSAAPLPRSPSAP
jgi:hypothetical protein